MQYLSDVLHEIPSNVILYKTLPGLGATYCEIKANRNSIIIEPNKPVMDGKKTSDKHKDDNLFCVYEGVYAVDVEKYIERSQKAKKHLKILTTPESFFKVQDALETLDVDIKTECFLLFDECHKIIKDIDYRQSVSLPIDLFFECENKSMVSATPLSFSDPRFEQNGFVEMVVKPDFDYRENIKLFATNNTLIVFSELLKSPLLNEDTLFVFCNSTDAIYGLMKQLDILEDSAVFCSDKSVEKLKHKLKFHNAYNLWNPKLANKINFFTSRFYNAVDIELDFKPIVIMFTDCYVADYMAIDPHTDAVQIVGRFRNGVKGVFHISNTNSHYENQSRENVEEFIRNEQYAFMKIKRFRDTDPTKNGRKVLDEILQTFNDKKYLNNDGTINYYYMDNYVDEEMLQSTYCSIDNLVGGYETEQFFKLSYERAILAIGDDDRLKIENYSRSTIEKRKEIVRQLKMLGDCNTNMEVEYREKLRDVDSLIVDAFYTLGEEQIEKLRYSQKKIKEALIVKKYKDTAYSTPLIELVYNSFSVGKWYGNKYIKKEIQRIYAELEIIPQKAITANTIEEYFVVKEHRKNNARGKNIVKKLF